MNKSTQAIVGGGIFFIVGIVWVILSMTALSEAPTKFMFLIGGAAFFVFGAMQLAPLARKGNK